MRKSVFFLLAGAMLASGTAIGKLPPPTPDEQADVAVRKEKEQAELEKQKVQLERAQDRIVAQYRKSSRGAQRAAGRPSDDNMPKATSELPGGTGPRPDRNQSGESHSAPAK